jgi:pyruvate/2-oxoglutarate dehydrogenase complex dihydrolipoamide acyltransferase (E2) component
VRWIDGRPEPRVTQSVTVTIDHDVVDGAPAARFGQTLIRLLEDGAGLDDSFAAEAARLSGVRHAVA